MTYYGIFPRELMKELIGKDMISLDKNRFFAKASEIGEERIKFAQEKLKELVTFSERVIDAEIQDKYGVMRFSGSNIKKDNAFIDLINNPDNKIVSLTIILKTEDTQVTMRIFEDGIVGISPQMKTGNTKKIFRKYL